MNTNHFKPGTKVPVTGAYWCTVCKLPAGFEKDQEFPTCRNKCGRGVWELVKIKEPQAK